MTLTKRQKALILDLTSEPQKLDGRRTPNAESLVYLGIAVAKKTGKGDDEIVTYRLSAAGVKEQAKLKAEGVPAPSILKQAANLSPSMRKRATKAA